MINAANPLSSMAVANAFNTPGKPGTANHSDSSTSKNTGNEARTNNREILIINRATGIVIKQLSFY